MMNWHTYYKLHKDSGTINEIVMQYNMYVYQNEEQYDVEMIRKMGSDFKFILQEEKYNYILLQEGVNEYGILQEY
jgi:hypothetical protein